MKHVLTFEGFVTESDATLLSGSWVLTKDYRYLATVGNYRDDTLHIEFRDAAGNPATTYYNIKNVWVLTPEQVQTINNNPEDFEVAYSLEDESQKLAQEAIRKAVKKHFSGEISQLKDFE